MDIFTERGRGELANYVVRSMRIGKYGNWKTRDAVRIKYSDTDPECAAVAKRVSVRCRDAGAHTIILPHDSKLERSHLEASPNSLVSEMNPFMEGIYEKATVRMFIGLDDDPNAMRGLEERVALGAPNNQRLEEMGNTMRSLHVGYPVANAARAYGLEPDRLKQIFSSAIKGSADPRTKALCNYYRIKLSGASEIRIFDGNGTDLRMFRGSRPVMMDDGWLSDEDIESGYITSNIPPGETFLAPIEKSVEGIITFPGKNIISGFGEIENLVWMFEGGRIVKYGADKGKDNFTRYLAAHTGGKDVFAELGIGCNVGAEYTGGIPIIDEKIAKHPERDGINQTIHGAIGQNRIFGGNNLASNHSDMIRRMDQSDVEVDSETIMFGNT